MEAVQDLERALALDARASAIHYPLAMAYRGLGDRQKADGQLRLRGTSYPPLPDPLTLEDALRLAGDNHPTLALSRAALAEAEAGAERTAAQNDLDIGARLDARLIDPSGSPINEAVSGPMAVAPLSGTR